MFIFFRTSRQIDGSLEITPLLRNTPFESQELSFIKVAISLAFSSLRARIETMQVYPRSPGAGRALARGSKGPAGAGSYAHRLSTGIKTSQKNGRSRDFCNGDSV